MNFTFGIITDGKNPDRVEKIIDSIENSPPESYEIIIVGGGELGRDRTKVISFSEDVHFPKISEKKNIITEESMFENVVYLHDYIKFSPDWYQNFKKFGNDFDVCMNRILNKDLTRYRDWCIWQDDAKKYVSEKNYLIPYHIQNLTGMMYISGAYWVAKKEFMIKNKLNENLRWGQGEDVEWSLRVRNFTKFKMNEESIVHLMKYKDRIFNEITPEEEKILSSISNYKNDQAYEDLIKNHLWNWMK
jgi:hypothetical protein